MNHPAPTALPAGKRWRLRRLANDEGFFTMVAIDQRPPLFAQLARGLGCPAHAVPFAEVADAKRVLAQAFAGARSEASAMLVDPNWGYVGAADVLSPRQGLVLTLEDHRTTADRRSSAIANWSVRKIGALGGDAVKLLAWYHPEASAEVRAHQQAFVQAVGEACAHHELPFVLELLLYPLAGSDDAAAYRQHAGAARSQRAEWVRQSVRTFASAHYGVDLFKLESPWHAAEVPALGAAHSAECSAAFKGLGEACAGRPWVMLSAGAEAADFERVVAHAARAGAAGFLAGRALWADSLARWPDRSAVRAHLAEVALPRLAGLSAVLRSEGQPWQPAPWAPGIASEGEFAAQR